MSADLLRYKAQQRQSKARLEALFSIIIGLILCVFFARTVTGAQEIIPRIGLGLLSLWSLFFAYQSYKWIWPGRSSSDPALNSTLESYRSQLEKQRDYVRHIWRRAGLPFCFFGLALVVIPEVIKLLKTPRLLVNFVPFFVLLVLWFAIFLPLRKRNQRKLQREIDELRAFERESRT